MSSYICEITPPSRRGPLTTGPQLLLTFGLLAGYFTCYGTTNIESSLSWRSPFIILASLSVAFSVATSLWLIPSPRWLTLKGHHSEAAAAWDLLQVDEIDREKTEVEDDEEHARHGLREPVDSTNISTQEKAAPPDKRPGNCKANGKFLDAFARDVRARTILALFIMGMQQLSGIDGVLYVSSEIPSGPSEIAAC